MIEIINPPVTISQTTNNISTKNLPPSLIRSEKVITAVNSNLSSNLTGKIINVPIKETPPEKVNWFKYGGIIAGAFIVVLIVLAVGMAFRKRNSEYKKGKQLEVSQFKVINFFLMNCNIYAADVRELRKLG